MKCRRVENLIPLYVENDLAASLSERVSLHLEWCGRCNWLLDEYKESQNWLHSGAGPELDEAELNAFKAGVLRSVAQNTTKAPAVANLIQHWTRRQLFAFFIAILFVSGMVLLYVYQTRENVKIAPPQKAVLSPEPEPAPAPAPGLAGEVEPKSVEQAFVNKRKRPAIKARRNALLAKHRFEANPGGDPAQFSFESEKANRASGMLRIEFQTSDPNIRIIWFAPKETNSSQKPATD